MYSFSLQRYFSVPINKEVINLHGLYGLNESLRVPFCNTQPTKTLDGIEATSVMFNDGCENADSVHTIKNKDYCSGGVTRAPLS